jgi:hypothetical protein
MELWEIWLEYDELSRLLNKAVEFAGYIPNPF